MRIDSYVPTFRRSVPLPILVAAPFVGLLTLAACDSNPPLGPDLSEGELEVTLTVSPDHVHIHQTEATFTVTARDHDGEAVTDFEHLAVERLQEGSDTWREIELEPAGESFTGTYVFASSGEYQLRVVGQRHGETEPTVLHESPDHLHVARAHAEAGGYRVEFETFPGHIHEGDEATATFWVMEAEADADGNRAPIEGLDAQARFEESDGSVATYDAHAHEAGEYEAHHTFDAAGDCHVALLFTGTDGEPAEADFHIHVSHGH